MALSIESDEADRLAQALAALTGESVTDAVIVSLRERLARFRAQNDDRPLAERLMAIGRQYSTLPIVDDRAPDELVGYDEDGLPT